MGWPFVVAIVCLPSPMEVAIMKKKFRVENSKFTA
jgi:hypothetical protein